MANKNKPVQRKASPALFHILKAVVDSKVPKLKSAVTDGRNADAQIPEVWSNINDLNAVIENARRYDPSEVPEYEESLNWHETRMAHLEQQQKNGIAAAAELEAANKFATLYHREIEIPAQKLLRDQHRRDIDARIAKLYAAYNKLEADDDRIDNQINACDINMETHDVGSDIYQQAVSDLIGLRETRANIDAKMGAILREIKSLQLQR